MAELPFPAERIFRMQAYRGEQTPQRLQPEAQGGVRLSAK